MAQCNTKFTKAAWSFCEGKGTLDPAIKTFMLLAFCSEVDLPPTEVQLCERHDAHTGKSTFWFEPIQPYEPVWRQKMQHMQAEIAVLRDQLKRLKEKGQS